MTAIAAGTNDVGPAGGRFTNEVMLALGADMCPQITYTFAQRAGATTNIAAFGIGEPDVLNTAPGMMVSTAGRPLTPADQVNNADSRPLTGYGVMGALASSGFRAMADAAAAPVNPIPGDLAAAEPNAALLCRCTTAATGTINRASCPYCGCNNFGVPTMAPTAIPTSAPTAASLAPVSSTITSASDDSLSGGAIAGIVIGSVVGAALVIGAGVMIGSK